MNRFFNFLSIAKKSKNLLEGYSKCDDYRNNTDIYLFIMSNDLSDKSKSKFKKHCENKNIPYIEDFYVGSRLPQAARGAHDASPCAGHRGA